MNARLLCAGLTIVLVASACGSSDVEEPDAASEETVAGSFDRTASEEQARALLGVPCDDVEESADVRIVRRNDEEFGVTMDLRPGRLNVEGDDDDTGTCVVTRVIVEVGDDGEPLVVE